MLQTDQTVCFYASSDEANKHRSGGTGRLNTDEHDRSNIVSRREELVFSESDLIDMGGENVARLGASAEDLVRTRDIRRLVLQTDRIVDLSELRVVLVPEIDEVTEIICGGGLIATRLHATNIKVEGDLVVPFGLVSTDPDGYLAVGRDMLCDKVFARDVAVGGILSTKVLVAENLFASRIYVGQLVGGINSISVPTERRFEGEYWTRGVYIGSAKEISLGDGDEDSVANFKKLLEKRVVSSVNGEADTLDRYRLRQNEDLTIVGAEKIQVLQASLNRAFACG